MKVSTKPTPENIEKILDRLAETPARLQALSRSRSAGELSAPLAQGEWSFKEIVAHLYACAELISHATYYALLVEGPVLPDVHPQRHWARLLRFEEFSLKKMLTSFAFEREVFVQQLSHLMETQWLRPITRKGKRQENIYRIARSMALHELTHLDQLEAILA